MNMVNFHSTNTHLWLNNVTMARRLVYSVNLNAQKINLKFILSYVPPLWFYYPIGCQYCNFTGSCQQLVEWFCLHLCLRFSLLFWQSPYILTLHIINIKKNEKVVVTRNPGTGRHFACEHEKKSVRWWTEWRERRRCREDRIGWLLFVVSVYSAVERVPLEEHAQNALA